MPSPHASYAAYGGNSVLEQPFPLLNVVGLSEMILKVYDHLTQTLQLRLWSELKVRGK
jgi:hypothetical protein